jgi:hypothetical protein
MAIVGSTIAAKSTAEIVILLEVFIMLSKGLRPAQLGRYTNNSPSSTPPAVNN